MSPETCSHAAMLCLTYGLAWATTFTTKHVVFTSYPRTTMNICHTCCVDSPHTACKCTCPWHVVDRERRHPNLHGTHFYSDSYKLLQISVGSDFCMLCDPAGFMHNRRRNTDPEPESVHIFVGCMHSLQCIYKILTISVTFN